VSSPPVNVHTIERSFSGLYPRTTAYLRMQRVAGQKYSAQKKIETARERVLLFLSLVLGYVCFGWSIPRTSTVHRPTSPWQTHAETSETAAERGRESSESVEAKFGLSFEQEGLLLRSLPLRLRRAVGRSVRPGRQSERRTLLLQDRPSIFLDGIEISTAPQIPLSRIMKNPSRPRLLKPLSRIMKSLPFVYLMELAVRDRWDGFI
jgi:hypothetical protein